MSRKIFGVLGLGVFGHTIAQELSSFDQEVIVLDNKPVNIQEIADSVSRAVVGDITDLEFLKASGIDSCDVVIIATGENLESSALALLNCKKLGIKTIIAKAADKNYEEILYGIGATQVISPERSTGKTLVSSLLRQKITNVFHLEDDLALVEFDIPESWVGKSLTELNLRENYHLNIIGIRPDNSQALNPYINPQDKMKAGVSISAIASQKTFETFDYLGFLK